MCGTSFCDWVGLQGALFFSRPRKQELCGFAKISKCAEMPGGIEEGAGVCACGSHARTYYTFDRVILSCRGSSKFSPYDSVFASVLGRICNSDAGAMPAEARTA